MPMDVSVSSLISWWKDSISSRWPRLECRTPSPDSRIRVEAEARSRLAERICTTMPRKLPTMVPKPWTRAATSSSL